MIAPPEATSMPELTRGEEGARLAQLEAEDRRVEAALRVWREIHDDCNLDDDPEDLDHAAMSFALAEADKHLTAESEVARLTAEVARVEAERDEAKELAEHWRATASDEAEIGNERHASASALRERVDATLTDACRMSAILLMAGEMTAQQRRTASAVANGIAAKVRAALKESSDA